MDERSAVFIILLYLELLANIEQIRLAGSLTMEGVIWTATEPYTVGTSVPCDATGKTAF